MARLKLSITVGLGMAILTLANHRDNNSSMFKSDFPEKCAECFEKNLAICGKMQPDDM